MFEFCLAFKLPWINRNKCCRKEARSIIYHNEYLPREWFIWTTMIKSSFVFFMNLHWGMSALFEFALRQPIRQWKDDSSPNEITCVPIRLKLSAILYLTLAIFSISSPIALTATWYSRRLGGWRGSREWMIWAESLGSPVTVTNARSCTSVWEQCVTYLQLNPTLNLIQSTLSTPTSPWSHCSASNNPTALQRGGCLCWTEGKFGMNFCNISDIFLHTYLGTRFRLLKFGGWLKALRTCTRTSTNILEQDIDNRLLLSGSSWVVQKAAFAETASLEHWSCSIETRVNRDRVQQNKTGLGRDGLLSLPRQSRWC